MIVLKHLKALVVANLIAAGAVHGSALAQPAAAPFPAGKDVSIYVGFGPGGANDLLMRLVARHIGKHLPGNPTVIPRNRPGAGGRTLGKYMYSIAHRDGTELALMQRTNVIDAALVDANAGYKNEEMTWLGSPSTTTDLCWVWHTSPIQTLADTAKQQLSLGSTSTADFQAAVITRLAKGNVRTVRGYESGAQVDIAIERGETDGRCSQAWEALKVTHSDWIEQKKVRAIVTFTKRKHPELAGVPSIEEFSRDHIDREAMKIIFLPSDLGFPFYGPPGLRPEVRDMLRRAFVSTMADPQFIEGAKALRLDVEPVTGEAIQTMFRETFAMSPAALERAKALVAE